MLLFAFTMALVHLLGIVPDPDRYELRRRAVINEMLAISSSFLAQTGDDQTIEDTFRAIVTRYPDISSACIRRNDGSILLEMGDHLRHWHLQPGAASTQRQYFCPHYERPDALGNRRTELHV